MSFVKPLRFLLVFIFAVSWKAALAADQETSLGASQRSRYANAQAHSSRGDPFALSLLAPGGKSDDAFTVRTGRGQRIELSPFAGVCFTMRSYKVKRTERLRDDESGVRGYSTCEMGSNYQVRMTDDDPPAKLK